MSQSDEEYIRKLTDQALASVRSDILCNGIASSIAVAQEVMSMSTEEVIETLKVLTDEFVAILAKEDQEKG